eukprot:TRINITY_DN8_c0_g4_i1.p1 TRINITY_DN8_c0_g4~~TRINITY_DN8_c0_g4_i1.p1  ORF type:complete len:222 (-),score=91.01 TRINITY_DN8_c0_g4_i1:75-659(-)
MCIRDRVSTQSTWGKFLTIQLKSREGDMGKQPSLGQKKSKEAIAKAASSSKKGKKKWSKGKVKEKLALAVFFDQATFDKLNSDIPKLKLITPSIVSDKLKVNMSIARRGIRYLKEKGLIKNVDHHASFPLCTGLAVKKEGEGQAAAAAGGAPKGGKGGKGGKQAAAAAPTEAEAQQPLHSLKACAVQRLSLIHI